MASFEIISEITDIEVIATGRIIRDLSSLPKAYSAENLRHRALAKTQGLFTWADNPTRYTTIFTNLPFT